MGHIMVKARFYNPEEYAQYARGSRPLAQVRQAVVEALVDSGATFPGLPEEVVESLSLPILGEMELDTFGGRAKAKETFAIIEIEGRLAACSVVVKPAGSVPLVGVVALEQMAYRLDPVTGKLLPGLAYMM